MDSRAAITRIVYFVLAFHSCHLHISYYYHSTWFSLAQHRVANQIFPSV